MHRHCSSSFVAPEDGLVEAIATREPDQEAALTQRETK